ncbi:MAG: class I tRNA ligase family protein [Candidatus Kaistia colombiensis]|nr:MAG: class I tRNA ligase family protein [Kaistia sp.]
MREVPFGQDGNYSHEAIINRINADLANDLGNLAQRSLSMIGKNLEGIVPQPGASSLPTRTSSPRRRVAARPAATRWKAADPSRAEAIWGVVAEANRYFANQAPWQLRKTDPERAATVLYVTAEVIRQIAILSQPVMPGSAGKLLDLLAIPESGRSFASLGAHAGRLAPGSTLPTPAGVFPRYVEAEEAEKSA